MGTVHHYLRSAAPRSTIGGHALAVDARRYLCPEPLDRKVRSLLDRTGTQRVLVVTGRGGVGKSAALREVARRAQGEGHRATLLDARVQDVVRGVEELADGAPGVVLVDEADAIGAAIAALGAAIAALPDGSRVVVAGRVLPGRWLPDTLAPLVDRCRLHPLPPGDADALLSRYDVASPAVRSAITAWAGGLPLALVVGARAWAGREVTVEDGWGASVAGTPPAAFTRDAGEDLWTHLADAALDDLDPELLAVLALTAGVDGPLLDSLFPDRAATMLAELRACTVVEGVAGRLMLHPSLADLLAERLRAEEPARASSTVLRLAAHEHARALGGEGGALGRLAGLVQDPGLRAAIGPAVRAGHYADRWRSGDAAVVRAGLERAHPGAWSVVEPWLGPHARLVRRADGRPVATVASMSLAAAAAVTGAAARLVAPVVAHARAAGPADRVVVSAFQLTFDDLEDPEVTWVRNAAGLAQCGVVNPRHDLVNVIGDCPSEREVLAAWGYVEIAGSAREVDGVPVTSWWADAGEGGMAGLLHAAVVAEQGGPAGTTDERGALLDALESFHRDAALAALPVAPPGERSAAAREVRAWVRSQVERLLGDEPALRDLVVRRYLVEGASHASVMRATYLSRATYFRRLRRARDLLGAGAEGLR
jgi:hypothetical protein